MCVRESERGRERDREKERERERERGVRERERGVRERERDCLALCSSGNICTNVNKRMKKN